MNAHKIVAGALGLAALFATQFAAPRIADAFCGFYVAGADAELYNDATVVVMMRDGTRTVLAMQNDYQGPPEDFAMVVPVPVVLSEDDVRTLDPAVFDRVDKLAAPRLVEYWEMDPCQPELLEKSRGFGGKGGVVFDSPSVEENEDGGVTIEAQFTVGEYEIVILSAKDSSGLDTWLRDNGYKIPEGAEPLLRPYVESGSKFFVAKVDSSKVKYASQPDGSKRATLSPLRIHYDSEQFALPVRLGLINAPASEDGSSGGAQDLLVHVLARNTRYQVANYPNVTIPTNLNVKDRTREHFGQFYVSLFDHTLEQHPKAVVTEYAWSAASCDPCPEPALTLAELATLGADVLPAYADRLGPNGQVDDSDTWSIPSEFVLTRLHARYDASSLGEDLVFEEAPAIAGGREFLQANGKLEEGAVPSPGGNDMFQARYAIRHAWEGEIACKDPIRGRWGGPPGGQDDSPAVARKLATVDRSASLGTYVTAEAGAQLGIAVAADDAGPPAVDDGGEAPAGGNSGETPSGETPAQSKSDSSKPTTPSGGCQCGVDETPGPRGALALALAALAWLPLRRRRRAGPNPSSRSSQSSRS